MVKIEFDNTGPTFIDNADVARILVQLSGVVLNVPGNHERHVHDSEGGRIGTMTITDD